MPGSKAGRSLGNFSGRRRFLQSILEQRSASTYGLVLVVVAGLLGATQAISNILTVTVVAAVVIYEFQKRLDQGVPLLQLTALIATMQWLVGPVLAYNNDYQYGKYSMYVSESVYFEYALPGTALYVAVMLAVGASIRQRELLQTLDRSNFVKIGFFLNIVSLAASILAPRFGGTVQFLLFLLSQARYVGAIYFLLSNHPLRYIFAAGSFSFLLIGSLSVGMFHDMLLWLAVIFCYWFARKKWVLHTKLIVLSTAGLMLFGIQVVKQDYRAQLRRGETPSFAAMFISYLTPQGKGWDDASLANAISRLNQGWIISAIMDNVPAEVPFADGETIKDAVVSAVLPRVLAPDKKEAGGRENFIRFTGLLLGEGTSMGISPLGEAYANFGVFGGCLLMMGFGALFAFSFKLALVFVARNPSFFFWLPMVFYQSIKAETELVVVLNQITKGAIVAYVLYKFTDINFPVRAKRMFLKPASVPVRRFSNTATTASG